MPMKIKEIEGEALRLSSHLIGGLEPDEDPTLSVIGLRKPSDSDAHAAVRRA